MRLLSAMAALALLSPAAPAAAASPVCDAACLTGVAGRYVAALAQRGASAGLPWAARVRYSENGVPMMVDDGIWATVTAHGATPLVIADPAASTVTWMGEVEEHGQPAFLALRLKVAGRAIAEAEAVIRRKEGRPPFADPATFGFGAGLADTLPPAARTSRLRLAAIARSYVAGRVGTQPASGCVRVENGVARAGCAIGGMEAVRGVAVGAVDEGRGLVTVMGVRDYAGVAGAGAPPADAPFPHSYAFAIVIRVQDGAVARVEEVSSPVPYRMPTWEDHR